MIKFYKSPEVQDQLKNNSGNILFGVQNSPTYKPLYGYINNTNNSAIVSFTAVKVDSKGVEISRTTRSTLFITVDSTNNLYKIDLTRVYTTLLDKCIYYFEVQNDSQLYKSEFFLVQEDTVRITFDSTLITWDSTLITFDQTSITI